ncbi:MAG: hypothetical protein ACI8W8_002123 [Rhodothermales bacterium]
MAGVKVDAFDLAMEDSDVAIAGEDTADGLGNFGWAQASHCDLVEQRLEKMVVSAIDECDLYLRLASQHLRSVQTSETTADYHGLFHGEHPRIYSYPTRHFPRLRVMIMPLSRRSTPVDQSTGQAGGARITSTSAGPVVGWDYHPDQAAFSRCSESLNSLRPEGRNMATRRTDESERCVGLRP